MALKRKVGIKEGRNKGNKHVDTGPILDLAQKIYNRRTGASITALAL